MHNQNDCHEHISCIVTANSDECRMSASATGSYNESVSSAFNTSSKLPTTTAVSEKVPIKVKIKKNFGGWGISDPLNEKHTATVSTAVWNFREKATSTTAKSTAHCQFCSSIVDLPQHMESVVMERSELLKHYGTQLTINPNEIPIFYTNDLGYFCSDCKQKLECMWELEQLMSTIALKLQKKTVTAALEGLVRKPVNSGTFDAVKFTEFRGSIIQKYYENKNQPEHPLVKAGTQPERNDGIASVYFSTAPPINIPAPALPVPAIFNDESLTGFNFNQPTNSVPTPKPPTASVSQAIKREPVFEQDVSATYDVSDDPNEVVPSMVINVEPIIEQDGFPYHNVTDDPNERIIEIKPPVGRRGKTCCGVEILNCVDNENGIKFFQCGACTFKAYFGWNDTDQQKREVLRKKMRPHIKETHQHHNQKHKKRPTQFYHCRVCFKRLAYKSRFRAHLKTHPELFSFHPIKSESVLDNDGMPILSPQATTEEFATQNY